MTYLIFTDDAESLVQTIVECVQSHQDVYDRQIDTWNTYEDDDESVIVHTTNNWEDKGYVDLLANDENNAVQVIFHYWDNCDEDIKRDSDEAYYLGRFTELLFAHFRDEFNMAVLS